MADAVRLFSAKIMREKLSAWERKDDPKAPLSDAQKDSFMELTTNVSNRPLPIEVSALKQFFNFNGFATSIGIAARAHGPDGVRGECRSFRSTQVKSQPNQVVLRHFNVNEYREGHLNTLK